MFALPFHACASGGGLHCYVACSCRAQFYKLTNSHQQISSYVFDVVRSTVPKMNLDDVFIVSGFGT